MLEKSENLILQKIIQVQLLIVQEKRNKQWHSLRNSVINKSFNKVQELLISSNLTKNIRFWFKKVYSENN